MATFDVLQNPLETGSYDQANMKPSSSPHHTSIQSQLQPALPGILFAVLTLLYGFGIGIVFGLNEDLIKDHLKDSAVEVQDSVYEGDAAAMKPILSKSWAYMKRAHLHAGGLGASAIGLILLVGHLGVSAALSRAISLGLGVGGLGYSIFWMCAGFRAPALGSTGAAKESLAWLAMPSSGAVVVATFAVALLVLVRIVRCPKPANEHDVESQVKNSSSQ